MDIDDVLLDVEFWKEKWQWKPAETAPRNGKEFLACNMRQGGVTQLVSWDTIHGNWVSKGEYVWAHSFTHWAAIPPTSYIKEQ